MLESPRLSVGALLSVTMATPADSPLASAELALALRVWLPSESPVVSSGIVAGEVATSAEATLVSPSKISILLAGPSNSTFTSTVPLTRASAAGETMVQVTGTGCEASGPGSAEASGPPAAARVGLVLGLGGLGAELHAGTSARAAARARSWKRFMSPSSQRSAARSSSSACGAPTDRRGAPRKPEGPRPLRPRSRDAPPGPGRSGRPQTLHLSPPARARRRGAARRKD
jgi:hypothetical protein